MLTGIIISGAVALVVLLNLLYSEVTRHRSERERDLYHERELTRARLRRCLRVESTPAHAIRDPYLRDWPKMDNAKEVTE